ncbi:hypothetical protein O6H91_07G074600 [Diphasiastrum complanatum]|uniref:Uncharacterized protein n=1 Tax=Diphasiastrum complanatum TaxID=34168 RepID=A0ACC2D6Q1_DIPCM|nr:hypothetical protein O6H91_07G074600 [Diphasiastrum complanatum]
MVYQERLLSTILSLMCMFERLTMANLTSSRRVSRVAIMWFPRFPFLSGSHAIPSVAALMNIGICSGSKEMNTISTRSDHKKPSEGSKDQGVSKPRWWIPDPVTGIWEPEDQLPELAETAKLIDEMPQSSKSTSAAKASSSSWWSSMQDIPARGNDKI